MNRRKHLTPEQKVIILRELLENQVPISQLAEKYQLHVNDIYRWKKQLFEGAAVVLKSKAGQPKQSTVQERIIEQLQKKLKQRDEVISEIVQENIELKKNLNGGN
jgi:transposase-like protein